MIWCLAEDWESETCFVRITYDRLHEHLLANHIQRGRKRRGFFALLVQADHVDGLQGALIVTLERAALAGQLLFLANLIDSGTGIAATLVDKTQELFLDFMVRLGSQGHPAYEKILEALLEEATSNDTLFLERLVKKLDSDSRYPEQAKKAAIAVWGKLVSYWPMLNYGLSALKSFVCSVNNKKHI